MRLLVSFSVSITLAWGAFAAASLAADAQVEIVLVTKGRVPLTAPQQWGGLLAQAGFRRPTIRRARLGDELQVATEGTASRPVYRVTGFLMEDGTVILPPRARFSQRDGGRLMNWVQDLKENGPAASQSPQTAFGLSSKHLQQVQDDLRQVVREATKGAAALDVVTRLSRRLQHPMALSASGRAALATDGKVRDELKGLSIGTALAAILRPAGLVMRPRLENGRLEYSVVSSRNAGDNWPIGWAPKKTPGQLIPGLFEKEDTQAVQVPLAAALDELSDRIGAPFLMDHNALAVHRIDPQQALVQMKPGTSHYSSILNGLLRQLQLRYEARVDDNDKPLLWITTLKR